MSTRRTELPGQLTLDSLDTAPVRVQATRPTRPRQPRSIGWARCPHGNHGRVTGVYYATSCRLVFRDHTIRLGGAVLLCRGSGQPVPDNYSVHEG